MTFKEDKKMSLVINHNMMAMNTARNLTESYGRLATSVQRLSTGMRINSAADDAAGLAIRETMRAEIAALNQGIRNAQDGISMIQTAEGALAVIDEKLIRMKELAEQAATGTYTEAQRLIIHSEFAAMASEIDRIAESTEFNGIKLLNGDSHVAGYEGHWSQDNTWQANAVEGEDGSGWWTNHSGWTESNGVADADGNIQGGIKIHFGTTNQRNEDYYFARIADSRTLSLFSEAGDPALIKPDTIHLQGQAGADEIQALWDEGEYDSIQLSKDAQYGASNNITAHAGGFLAAGSVLTEGTNIALTHGQEIVIDGVSFTYLERGFNQLGTEFSEDGSLSTHAFGGLVNTEAYKNGTFVNEDGTVGDWSRDGVLAAGVGANPSSPTAHPIAIGGADGVTTTLEFTFTPKVAGDAAGIGTISVASGQTFTTENAIKFTETDDLGNDTVIKAGSILNLGDNGVPAHPGTPEPGEDDPTQWADPPTDAVPGDGPALELNTTCDGIEIIQHERALTSLDGSTPPPSAAGRGPLPSLLTQHQAQDALEHIDTAILRKENIRASLGAIQNRLENTITNLSIQAENLQASESRISDVDIANEMTEFVRNQVLTQAAVAMLGQANSLPQMALRLLG